MPTLSVIRQPDFAEQAECPKCRNREGIKDGGPALRGVRAYDVRTDTFGLCRCPRCGLKAHWSQFHTLRVGQQETLRVGQQEAARSQRKQT